MPSTSINLKQNPSSFYFYFHFNKMQFDGKNQEIYRIIVSNCSHSRIPFFSKWPSVNRIFFYFCHFPYKEMNYLHSGHRALWTKWWTVSMPLVLKKRPKWSEKTVENKKQRCHKKVHQVDCGARTTWRHKKKTIQRFKFKTKCNNENWCNFIWLWCNACESRQFKQPSQQMLLLLLFLLLLQNARNHKSDKKNCKNLRSKCMPPANKFRCSFIVAFTRLSASQCEIGSSI